MMKTIRKIALVLLMCLMALPGYSQLVAFPGAEGYGRFATGGRGNGTTGRIAIVTNLEDDVANPPEGSFRWALRQGIETVTHPILGPVQAVRPLTVVFQVSGVIHLKGDIRMQRDNVTIAGQSAPGDGICFRGFSMNFGGSKNLIVRFIRSRPGDEDGANTTAFRLENGENFIIDHCSFSWAIEETIHISSTSNSTMQWCIISESLYESIHHKGPRAYAAQWGGQYASYHHNLLIHQNSRMPRINGSNINDVEAMVDYRNNVHYNWGSRGAFYGGEWEGTFGNGFCHTNVVNNYFKPGPSTPSNPIFARPSLNRSGVPLDGYGKWYVNGNYMDGDAGKTADNWTGMDGSEVGGNANIRVDEVHYKTIGVQPADVGVLENYDAYTETALDAYASVLDKVGAILPRRCPIDARLIAELNGDIPITRYAYTIGEQVTPIKGLTSGIIDTQKNLVPNDAPEGTAPWDVYEILGPEAAPLDTDMDGIPDEWEIANGLNHLDPLDSRQLSPHGYSWLELYLIELTGAEIPSRINQVAFNISFFPNPVTDILSFSSDEFIYQVEVYNTAGSIVKTELVNGNNGHISFAGLPAGFYMAKVKLVTGENVVHRVVKK